MRLMELDAAVALTCSANGLGEIVDNAATHHLQFLHRARLIAIRRLLPPATRILDLGGANAPLYRMGYEHEFQHLWMVDLPEDERHVDWQDVAVDAPRGDVRIRYGDMTDLSSFQDESFDFVWSGQSIEHVPQDGAARMVAEAFRVLEPGGRFCLDTPNRAVTRIHTSDWHGGFIHPDHHHEYFATELRQLLTQAGFEVVLERGICEMPQTVATQRFHYSDFVLGNPVTEAIENAYVLYFECRKPD